LEHIRLLSIWRSLFDLNPVTHFFQCAANPAHCPQCALANPSFPHVESPSRWTIFSDFMWVRIINCSNFSPFNYWDGYTTL
jgi:hypothetical protein